MMPHLAERDHDLLSAGGRLGQIAGFVAIPVGITASPTPRMRAVEQKLVFPIDESSTVKAFIAGGLPRGGGTVKLQPHERQR
jgi:hypothetical protein